MIPVTQTILDGNSEGKEGNCLPAAIASFLECKIEDIPHFIEREDWFTFMCNWIWEQGYELCQNAALEEMELALVFGDTVRGTHHAVLYNKGKLLHDPHPSRTGLVTIEWFAEITKREE